MKKLFLPDVYRKIAVVLLFLVSLNALAAGYSFITQPSGEGLGIGTGYLRPSAPFANYLVPGIVLFVVLGIGSSLVAIMALLKRGRYALVVLLQGALITGWILIQLMMVVSFHILHLVIGVIGIVLMLIGYRLHKNPHSVSPAVMET